MGVFVDLQSELNQRSGASPGPGWQWLGFRPGHCPLLGCLSPPVRGGHDVGVLPPPPRPFAAPRPYDATPTEIESRSELDGHLAQGSLRGLTVQGLRLDLDPPDLSAVDVTDCLFVGCRFPDTASAADVVRRGGSVVPVFESVPYPTTPSSPVLGR